MWRETDAGFGKGWDMVHFNPLPPCGGRPFKTDWTLLFTDFNPLPPCGGRRFCPNSNALVKSISIHSLRVEGDHSGRGLNVSYFISIHSLRVEGDYESKTNLGFCDISIHSLRVEGDRSR